MNGRTAVLLFFLGNAASGQAPPATTSAAQGRELYRTLCSRCHGLEGEGGLGPDLRTGVYYRAPDDGTLLQIISIGIPGTDMPRQAGLSLNGAIAIARYLRTLMGTAPGSRPAGNELLGQEIYRTRKCAQCHSIQGTGGAFGPDLTAIGRQRSLAHLRTALTDPSGYISEANLPVQVAAGGKTVLGIRVAEDTFTIRLRDASGALMTFDKAEVRIERLWDKSPMPSYSGVLSDKEIDDVAAYLATRMGTP